MTSKPTNTTRTRYFPEFLLDILAAMPDFQATYSLLLLFQVKKPQQQETLKVKMIQTLLTQDGE